MANAGDTAGPLTPLLNEDGTPVKFFYRDVEDNMIAATINFRSGGGMIVRRFEAAVVVPEEEADPREAELARLRAENEELRSGRTEVKAGGETFPSGVPAPEAPAPAETRQRRRTTASA